jgi:hypothetical protein
MGLALYLSRVRSSEVLDVIFGFLTRVKGGINFGREQGISEYRNGCADRYDEQWRHTPST